MGKWYCLCFPCCWGSGKNNVGTWGDHDDSAFREPRYHVRREDLGKLHRAAWWGKVPRADLIVMLRGPGVNKRDKKKRTALHLACANGNPEVVKLLLDRQCDLHVLDSKKRTALIKAVQCQEDECVLMLLEHGTDPNIPDVYGNTALHYAVYNEDKLLAKALLLYGADTESANKRPDLIRMAILNTKNHGIIKNTDRNSSGLTPLLLGVHGQKEQMVKFLIKKKANLNALDRFGSIVSILLQQDVDVFSQDASGWTAEDYAVSSHHDTICQLLSDYKEKQVSKNSSQNNNPEGTRNKIVGLAEETPNETAHLGGRAASAKDKMLKDKESKKRIKEPRRRGDRHGTIMYSSGGKDAVEKSVKETNPGDPLHRCGIILNGAAEEEMQKHGSNNVELPENLTNGVAPGCGDYGLIQRRRSRKPENQQSSSTENEQYHG
ncbi:hypothetical protein P7K49_026254 [Saguinus oedipus]|uniref:POTE ankyrin domain family member A n=1 Tax=Saguinus oedipus TaxID=9490 RepID=A0ABQ9UE09_SAGOE|nr:hypothetical protein P7K49_026254 [Saguinus oedipus]